jgi:hypothetical protein
LKKFEDILFQCIEDIKAGRSSIEDCLNRYPSAREQLEPLLRIALQIQELPDVTSSPSFKIKTRVWLMDQIHGEHAVKKWPWSRHISRVSPMPYIKRFSMSVAGVILVIIVAVSALGAGTAYASQSSLPGDALYPLKLATEQAGMTLLRDDTARAERALSFVERRIGEMEVLAEEGRSQDLGLAVQKYGYALNVALSMMERASDMGSAMGNITAQVAEATSRHLFVLDEIWDMVPNEAEGAIVYAGNVSEMGYFHAMTALARNNTVRAAEMNLVAMEGRLNRIRSRVQNIEALQIALHQFEAMAEFGEEISGIAQEISLNMTEVEELFAEATGKHLEVLADVWERVPEQAKPDIERAMASLMIRHQRRVQKLEEWGIDSPPSPAIPERVRERMEERIQEQEQWESNGTATPGQGIPAEASQQNGHGAN